MLTIENIKVYTPEEAAKMLHITPDAVRRRIYRKTLPAAKLGGRWVILEETLQQELKAVNELLGQSNTTDKVNK